LKAGARFAEVADQQVAAEGVEPVPVVGAIAMPKARSAARAGRSGR
jgi:hypothetical protein